MQSQWDCICSAAPDLYIAYFRSTPRTSPSTKSKYADGVLQVRTSDWPGVLQVRTSDCAGFPFLETGICREINESDSQSGCGD